MEVSVIVEDSLSNSSGVEMVMKEGDVFKDINILVGTIGEYKFLIQKQNGKRLTLKWDRFKNLTIDTLTCINNIDIAYLIILICNM